MARMPSRSSGVTRSSASRERIQPPVACSIAKFFWIAKPGHTRTDTLSVNSRAICTVLSADSASTTTISSAHATLSRQARSRSSSFQAMIVTVSLLTGRSAPRVAPPPPRPRPPGGDRPWSRWRPALPPRPAQEVPGPARGRGGDRNVELDRAGGEAERVEKQQVLAPPRPRAGGGPHPPVGEETVEPLAAGSRGEADADRRGGVGG